MWQVAGTAWGRKERKSPWAWRPWQLCCSSVLKELAGVNFEFLEVTEEECWCGNTMS